MRAGPRRRADGGRPRVRRARRPQPARGRGGRRTASASSTPCAAGPSGSASSASPRPGGSTSSSPRSCAATRTSRSGSSARTPRRSRSACAAASWRRASSCCRRRREARRPPDRARRGALRQRVTRAHERARDDRAARGHATGLLRRGVGRPRPDPPPARRARPGARRPPRPRVEVELKDIALRLVAAGIGDTYLPSAYTRAPYYPAGLHTAPFSPPLHDTFAIVSRTGARVSPPCASCWRARGAHARGGRRARPLALSGVAEGDHAGEVASRARGSVGLLGQPMTEPSGARRKQSR